MKWLRRRFGFYTISEVLSVIQQVGHCKDREEFEWKVKNNLTALGKPCPYQSA